MPGVSTVTREELAPTGARQRKHVLQIRRRRRHGADNGRIERPPPSGEEREGSDSACNLEPGRRNVSMRRQVARQVHDRAEDERGEA
jgi:hypothetical protein